MGSDYVIETYLHIYFKNVKKERQKLDVDYPINLFDLDNDYSIGDTINVFFDEDHFYLSDDIDENKLNDISAAVYDSCYRKKIVYINDKWNKPHYKKYEECIKNFFAFCKVEFNILDVNYIYKFKEIRWKC